MRQLRRSIGLVINVGGLALLVLELGALLH